MSKILQEKQNLKVFFDHVFNKFVGEYSTPTSKQQNFDEKYKEVLTGCVNKIRGLSS